MKTLATTKPAKNKTPTKKALIAYILGEDDLYLLDEAISDFDEEIEERRAELVQERREELQAMSLTQLKAEAKECEKGGSKPFGMDRKDEAISYSATTVVRPLLAQRVTRK